MRLISSYRGRQRVWEVPGCEFGLGGGDEDSPLLLDLSADKTISRLHARVWKEDGAYWIEDRQSSRGTLLNNIEIKGRGKQQLQVDDTICVGETTLRVQSLESQDTLAPTNYLEVGANLLSDKTLVGTSVDIACDLDAINFDPASAKSIGDSGALRLKLVCQLPLPFAARTQFEELLPTIVDRLVELIPNAESWALAVRAPQTDPLLVKAYRSAQEA